MPLNLSTGNGEYTPYLKYNAKAGRFYVRAEGASDDTEIEKPLLAFDMGTIRTGWISFQQDGPPKKVWDPSLDRMAQKPLGDGTWKRGFEVMVYSNAVIPRTSQKIGLREFCAVAATIVGPVVRMYEEYERSGLTGKIPVYACTGVEPVEGRYGTNFAPVFEFKQWVDRAKVPEFADHEVHREEKASPPEHTGFVSGLPQATQVGSTHATPKAAVKPKYDELNPPPSDRIPPHVKTSLEDEMSDEVPF